MAETRHNDVLRILLQSGKLNADSMTTVLLRKADWHDLERMRLLLEKGADPKRRTRWSYSPLHQSVRRDSSMQMIELLVEHGRTPRCRRIAAARRILWMPSTSRPQQRYDHRFRDLVQRTKDLTVVTDLGVPRSTARGWLRGHPSLMTVDGDRRLSRYSRDTRPDAP